MTIDAWTTHNPEAERRVLVTKQLPGHRWLDILIEAGCRVDVGTSTGALSAGQIRKAIGESCHGVIGQLTENWGRELFEAFAAAGGRAYSNYAVGFDNVDVPAATRHQIAVGNTPGVLTEATAEMAVALTFAAARRIVEADGFMRGGGYHGWLPGLFLGDALSGKTLGIVGAGRIGTTYARMMVEGFKMPLIYHDLHENPRLAEAIAAFSEFLRSSGRQGVTCERADSVEDLLARSDVVSLHPVLDDSTRHLIDRTRLRLMKETAVLVNVSRGAVIDEAALVEHCRSHPGFRAALDVFEDEPAMQAGLAQLPNVIVAPHIASATGWARESMAILAAGNVAAVLNGDPLWADSGNILPFLGDCPPKAAPSIVNGEALGLPSRLI